MNLHELIFGVHVFFSETKKQTNYIATHKICVKSVRWLLIFKVSMTAHDFLA